MRLNLLIGLVVGLLSAGLLFVLHGLGMLRTPAGEQMLYFAVAFHITGLITVMALQRSRAVKADVDAPLFARLFGSGLMVSLISGCVVAAGTLLFMEVQDPSYLDWIKERSLIQLASFELPPEESEAQRQQIVDLSARVYATRALVGTLISGFFLSLTIAAFMRIRMLRRK